MNSLPKLFAALSLALCSALPTTAAAQSARPVAPPAKIDKGEARRAEKIIAKLRRLDETASADERAYNAVFKKLYPKLFAEAARLREGDVKTDLTTAVFFHEAAYASRRLARASHADCDALLRDVYRRLCREQEGGTRGAAFMRAAARLHAEWAGAVLARQRGTDDASTRAALEEMRTERALDARLAARAVAALKTLAAEVHAYPSLYEFESRGEVARVSYEQFSTDLSDALVEVDRVLAELPRGALHRSLRNARNSFREGAAWWGRSSRAEAKTVAANSHNARRALKPDTREARAAGYTAVGDWRQAARSLAEAQAIIESLDGDQRRP